MAYACLRLCLESEGLMADLKTLAGVADNDRKLLSDAEAIVGPEPTTMGFVKNLFWGNVREDLLFPYPRQNAEEDARCQRLLDALDEYLSKEHPSTLIDQEQEI